MGVVKDQHPQMTSKSAMAQPVLFKACLSYNMW